MGGSRWGREPARTNTQPTAGREPLGAGAGESQHTTHRRAGAAGGGSRREPTHNPTRGGSRWGREPARTNTQPNTGREPLGAGAGEIPHTTQRWAGAAGGGSRREPKVTSDKMTYTNTITSQSPIYN